MGKFRNLFSMWFQLTQEDKAILCLHLNKKPDRAVSGRSCEDSSCTGWGRRELGHWIRLLEGGRVCTRCLNLVKQLTHFGRFKMTCQGLWPSP